jgi:ATP-dependent Clp protease ATP-binding subunit ClpC
MSDPLDITDREKLMALLEKKKKGDARFIDEEQLKAGLKSRVRGQDHVIDDMVRMLRLQWGKEQRGKPIANLLFLGPTGTGKTELAKAMAEQLYGDEKNMLRFDCSEFSGAEGKTRLIGTPTGYVGATSGGQLTRPMINNPKRIVLFDEIEKAYSGIFDLFLSMMGDGRLTEQGSGKVADFTKAIIILTSNAEYEAIGKIQAQIDDPHEMVDAVKKHLRDTQIFRPEIIGRFDKIYVFKPLEGIVNAEIAIVKMKKLAQEYGLELAYVDPHIVFEAMEKGNKLKDFGARELERVIGEMLGEPMLAAKQAGYTKIKVTVDDDGVLGIDSAA